MANMKDQSRINWEVPAGPTSLEHVQTGAVQRIADALELMTADYGRMKRDLEMYKQACKDKNADILYLHRRIAALQGVITKLKKAKQ